MIGRINLEINNFKNFKSTFKTKIYYEDVDVGGFCYHSKYLNFCERARSEIFFTQESSPIEDEYHFVVKTLTANYVSPGVFGDEVEVHSSLKEFKSASMTMFHQILNQEGKLLFEMDIVLVGMKGSKISKIPKSFREVFGV